MSLFGGRHCVLLVLQVLHSQYECIYVALHFVPLLPEKCVLSG